MPDLTPKRSKAATKGVKRKRKRIVRDETELAPVPRRQPNGQKRRPTEDAQAVVAKARVRQTGREGKDALDPLLGTDMGRCIDALASGEDRASLADAWRAMSAAHRNFRMLVIGRTADPKCATIAMMPEAMQVDPSLRIDIRTTDERAEAARGAWQRVCASFRTLPTPQHQWALRGALDGFMGEDGLWRDRTPTRLGRLAVDALRLIAKPA